MLPVAGQIQRATDTAKFAAGRLADLPSPRFADTELALDELRQRIDAAADYLKTIRPEQFDGSGARTISYNAGGAPLQSSGTAAGVKPARTYGPVGMKIAVMGAGAVGCYYGFKLARAGHDVMLIGRPQHIEAIEREGLRLETQTFDERIRVSASTEGSAVQGAQLVLFCVKSTDTESGAAAIKPHLAPDAVVLSLQNGVENADRLRALLPQEVIAAAVYVGTEMAGPGHVRHHGRGELVIERSKASDDLARALIAAGVPTDISDDVRGALWAKLITNCAYNALSAITQLPYGRLVKGEGVTVVLRDLVDECVAVAKTDGVTLPGDVDAAVRKIAETAAGQYSSTAQDLARGKRSEIDHLNGFIVRRGEALDVATPANRMLHAIVKLIESK
jgi:2-dehydropantoate 2-reductase